MRKLLFLLFPLLLFACSKNKDTKVELQLKDFERLSTSIELDKSTYAVGEEAEVVLRASYKVEMDKGLNDTKIVKLQVVSDEGQVYEATGLDINSEAYTSKIFRFKAKASSPAMKKLEFTFFHENGIKEKRSVEILFLKDRKLATWWDHVTYAYLDTVLAPKIVRPITDRYNINNGSLTSYGNKDEKFIQIEGLYGIVFPIFNQNKTKLQSIIVVNGYMPLRPVELDVIKNDILQAFPDCTITSTENGYRLRSASAKFSFDIVKEGILILTEINRFE